jgi:hypothetical protein
MIAPVKIYFAKHADVGALCAVLGSTLPWIKSVSPYIQFIGLIIGTLIGCITLYSKAEERILKFKRRQKAKKRLLKIYEKRI